MLDSLFVLGRHGHVVLDKHWCEPTPRQACEWFWQRVGAAGQPSLLPPVLLPPGGSMLVHVRRGDLFLLGAVGADVAPLFAIEMLDLVAATFADYFGEVSERALRSNFVGAQQVLEELADRGAPLHTEPNVLHALLPPPSRVGALVAAVTGTPRVASSLPESALSATPWRRVGARYAVDELTLEIHEALDATVDGATSMLQRAEVWGEVACVSALSGTPSLVLSFSNSHMLEDVALHRSVDARRWATSREAAFVPPDGRFILLTYRVRGISALPIYVAPSAAVLPPDAATPPATPTGNGSREGGGSGARPRTARLSVVVGSRHAGGLCLEDVKVSLQLPSCAASPSCAAGATWPSLSADAGRVSSVPESRRVTWAVGRVDGERALALTGTLALGPSACAAQPGDPLPLTASVEFRLPGRLASGLQVRELRLEREPYAPYKGVRLSTRAGRFQVRT